MIKCKYCGGENPDDNKFCMNCGAPLDAKAPDAVDHQEWTGNTQPMETQAPAPQPESELSAWEPNNGAPMEYDQPVNHEVTPMEPVPIGGLIAWAIIDMLGCLIPGIVALVYIFKINKAASYEEQQQLLTTSKRILIVGTVLCVLNLLASFGARLG